jgi:hypothetical protein
LARQELTRVGYLMLSNYVKSNVRFNLQGVVTRESIYYRKQCQLMKLIKMYILRLETFAIHLSFRIFCLSATLSLFCWHQEKIAERHKLRMLKSVTSVSCLQIYILISFHYWLDLNPQS